MPAALPTFADVGRIVRGHVPALDGVRGLAILLVLVHNGGGPDGPAPSLVLKLFDVATDIGWVGVQLFFVLSGFLITGILLDTREAPHAWSAFYMRRVLRIFPLYYAALGVAFGLMPLLLGHPTVAAPQAGWFFLYLQNWSPTLLGVSGATGNLPHLWSLAVEEQFYLVWPIVVLTLSRSAVRRISLSLVVLALVVRIVFVKLDLPKEWAYQNTFARADALALGGLGALIVRDEALFRWVSPRLRSFTWATAGALAVVVVASRGFSRLQPVSQTIGYSVIALFFVALVLNTMLSAAAEGPLARALTVRPLTSLGKYSYGVYMIHAPLAVVIRQVLGIDVSVGSTGRRMALRTGVTLLLIVLSYVGAVVSYHVFEKRFLDLKKRFVARPAPSV